MSFDSLHLAQEFYANYAKKVGFVTKDRNTNFDKTRKESKIPVNQSLHYTREGYRESRVKAATRANRITATRCRARMYVMLDREKECWVLSRELTMHAKCVITDNDKAGIRPNKTYLALANGVGGSSNLSFSEKDEINPNFFYAIDVDDANEFRSALWVDARCRASYEYYEDVVSFDTTYRRNRHGLPFASFVGVNHHGKSALLGCALLGSEEIPSFEWVFTQWVRCVGTAPRGIITEQCKVMAGAIRKVLPDTIHRWYGELNAMMNHIVWNSPSPNSFEADWAGFIKEFKLGQKRWLAGSVRAQQFESAGILCCHTLAVWSYYRVDTVPSCYVLPQWSKNVIRKHTYIKSSHDVARTDESLNLFRRLCLEFYNAAQEFVACDEEVVILRAALWDTKSKLVD
ncbi:protein FAR1-RELATED SEQUENCE 2-like [Arachis ipaensis]|uniref:protein FAR1-RELATED SEQUENCE 2-like n=1 Tax=Arachis ipaensis TaxID=130454 RepID=UPI0007AF777B|nr:protein FAR1-RELATED SEQUENCE 2-like [Arachis ipaensis]